MPEPELHPSLAAAEIAAELQRVYGDHALVGARSALQAAARTGDAEAVDLWAAVCASLATRISISR